MRCAGSTGCAVGLSSLPGILRDSPYMSSATDACRYALNDVGTWCSVDMVDSVVTHLAFNSIGASEFRKLGEDVVHW
jgi:hypothetical protein